MQKLDITTTADESQSLSETDRAKVDAFLNRGVNSVNRKPFKPLLLMVLLMAVVGIFSLLSQGIAKWSGIY